MQSDGEPRPQRIRTQRACTLVNSELTVDGCPWFFGAFAAPSATRHQVYYGPDAVNKNEESKRELVRKLEKRCDFIRSRRSELKAQNDALRSEVDEFRRKRQTGMMASNKLKEAFKVAQKDMARRPKIIMRVYCVCVCTLCHVRQPSQGRAERCGSRPADQQPLPHAVQQPTCRGPRLPPTACSPLRLSDAAPCLQPRPCPRPLPASSLYLSPSGGSINHGRGDAM